MDPISSSPWTLAAAVSSNIAECAKGSIGARGLAVVGKLVQVYWAPGGEEDRVFLPETLVLQNWKCTCSGAMTLQQLSYRTFERNLEFWCRCSEVDVIIRLPVFISLRGCGTAFLGIKRFSVVTLLGGHCHGNRRGVVSRGSPSEYCSLNFVMLTAWKFDVCVFVNKQVNSICRGLILINIYVGQPSSRKGLEPKLRVCLV